MCTLTERGIIEGKASAALLTVSEYLRRTALSGKIQEKKEVLPKEVLAYTATLNHIAGALNGIARKRSGSDELNALERAELQFFSGQFRRLAKEIKTFFQ